MTRSRTSPVTARLLLALALLCGCVHKRAEPTPPTPGPGAIKPSVPEVRPTSCTTQEVR